ncbi:XopAK family type III secretion system effector [Brenneria alni]|nr:XopAK family type III secretion system effector [Brenneria alni]
MNNIYPNNWQTHYQDLSDQEATNSGMLSHSEYQDVASSSNVTNHPQSLPSRVVNTATDHERQLSLAQMARPTAGNQERSSSNINMRPYRILEQTYRSLFNAGGIEATNRTSVPNSGRVLDVDMDECMATTTQHYNSIGTKALGPCVAICGRSKNESGNMVMGIYHYSGLEDANEAIDHLINSIKKMGGKTNIDIQLVGGCALEDEDESSLVTEQNLLSLSNEYNISAVRLHVSQGADEDDCTHYVNLIMTPEKTYYGPNLDY